MTDNANTRLSNPLVHQLPYAGKVREGISYADEARFFDIYLPERTEGPAPVVVLVTGYPDPGFEERVGLKQMQIQAYRDWAKLLAASGMAAVIYSNVEPVEDAFILLDFLRCEAGQLQIDPARIALWSCSGNVPNAINVLHKDSSLRCAALLYGFMLDKAGSSVLQAAAQKFGFVNPHKGLENFPENTPILVIRGGKDEFPGLNESIDNFEMEAVARNSPVSVIRYAEGVHAFDTLDDSQRSIEMIKLCVGFLRLRLNVY
ncbi:MAG: dienelactone hydrolase family protein [Gammaproteobacteria bacterium]|nr:dienelactone hydrolase family protein [Gammaproteobacteria bacterium]